MSLKSGAGKGSAPNSRSRITSATNDIGLITLPDGRHIAIAIYIQDSAADMWQREKVMADIAKAICDKWFGTTDANVKVSVTPIDRVNRSSPQSAM